MFALNNAEVLNDSFSSSVASDTTFVSQCDRDVAAWCFIDRLPREILLRIFINVIENDNYNFGWIVTFSTVCRHWYRVTSHPLLWEYVAKRKFVVYPLVMRLRMIPWDAYSQEIMDRMQALGATDQHMHQPDFAQTLPPPTRYTMRKAIEKVKRQKERNQYYKYVQRQRSFVLHLFLSLTLLFLSLSILVAMLAAEEFQFKGILCKDTVFGLLYMCYLCVAAMIVSNVVIHTHFEPQPLLLRLRKNRLLITASTISMVLGLCDVVGPTVLIHINLSLRTRFSWVWCGLPIILSFLIWQCYAITYIVPEAKQQLRQQMSVFSPREVLWFVVMNIPNMFPILFAIAALCGLHYVQYGGRVFVLLSCVPAMIIV
ncbi:hypothetical protein STCU_03812 [Strigomonas culicis]|uniref:F-box domain-containing protein n=1 Tax=Strigomonas culicis TaxID=28005 RepID=S9UFS4_9TRYP|nr:hypothetical protein STCU_04359 [Strigomonas culicis]EPY30891.1 hypothetical protein STCU_03812 [Strigomonas culicis]|eukprot:EPY29662.1 hypothetical protein STCU_04359 [Strigomonas culicis]